jgi:hypothetical protein
MSKDFFKNLQEEIEGKTIDELQCIFYETAKDLMNNYILKIDNLELELTEIEFYYNDEKYHKDLYAHGNELQKTSKYLYVHKRAPKRGGIDLTFGNDNFFGGILIRGIKNNNIYVSGPGRVKMHIAEKLNIENKYEKIQELFKNLKNENKISLKKINSSKDKYPVLHSIRVGLPTEIDEEFYNALYRFARLDHIEAEKKTLKKEAKLEDIPYLKSISNRTKVCTNFPNEKSEKINNNKVLIKNINKFIKCHKQSNNER